MRLELNLDDRAEISGTITGPDGIGVAFVGRLGLLAALEHIVARGVIVPEPPDTPSAPSH